LTAGERPQAARVVVATTLARWLISFWGAAAVVLCDLGSSMFYAGGIAGHAIGSSAPWFILAVMLFSFPVRAVYLESCSMFVRGGVYVVVRDAMGRFMARLSVSALIFDYILTGPISVVAAGLYLIGLAVEFGERLHIEIFPPFWRWMAVMVHARPDELFAAFFAIAITIYFWWSNIKGIHESSGKALRIMQITTAMVVIFLIW
jgi:amino acid transporter